MALPAKMKDLGQKIRQKLKALEGAAMVEAPIRRGDLRVPKSDFFTEIEMVEPAAPMVWSEPFYKGILPHQFGAWISGAAPFQAVTRDTDPFRVLEAHNASVTGRDGVILFEDGWVTGYHLQFAQVWDPACLVRSHASEAEKVMVTPPARRMVGKYLLGFNAGYTNYAHFTVDQLPVLIRFRDHYKAKGYKLLLPDAKPTHFSNQALRLLGVDEADIVRLGGETVEFEELAFAAPIFFDVIPEAIARSTAELKRGAGCEASPKPRRIFVSRPDSWARKLLNEAEVTAALEPLGFEVVAPGLLSVEDQIKTFDAAEIVVGPHGAGLANVGFCRPGATLIEVFSEYTLSAMFWGIASRVGMDYAYVSGTSFDQDNSLVDLAGGWDAAFILDPEQVRFVAQMAIDRQAARAA